MGIFDILKTRRDSISGLTMSLKDIDLAIERATEDIEEAQQTIRELIFDGPEKIDELNNEITQKKTEIATLKLTREGVVDQTAVLKAREEQAKIENGSEQAANDVRTMHNLGLKFLNLLDEALEANQEYNLKTRDVTNFIQAAAKAGRVDLKPAPDPVTAVFRGRGQLHPIEDPVLIQSIKIAVSQKNLLKKLGVEI